MDHSEMLRQQRALLAEAGLDITGLGQAPAADIYTMAPPPGAEAEPIPSAAAKLAVNATFSDEMVVLRDSDRTREVPYIASEGKRPHVDPARLAAGRLAISFAIVSDPERVFTTPDIQEIVGPMHQEWRRNLDLLKDWWSRMLTISGRPLIVPVSRTRPPFAAQANTHLAITVRDNTTSSKEGTEK
jgi:hypothetical protein